MNSIQYLSNGFITDFITLSVPSNFVPAGTVDNGGHTLNAIQFSIGDYLGGTNSLNLSPAISAYSVSGTATFVSNGVTTSGAVPMTSTLTNGTAFSTFGAIITTPSTADISNNDVTAFSIALTYAVPEPSTWTAMIGGLGLLGFGLRRRLSAV